MSIETELQEITGVKPRNKEARQKYLGRVVKAVEELDEANWAKLSEAAQAWYKGALKADESGEDIPDFPDTAKAEAAEDKKVATADEKKKPAGKKKAAANNGNGAKKARGSGYKGHREGSRKEEIHKVFDDKGVDAALKAAEKKGLSTSTARNWIYRWGGKMERKPKAQKAAAA